MIAIFRNSWRFSIKAWIPQQRDPLLSRRLEFGGRKTQRDAIAQQILKTMATPYSAGHDGKCGRWRAAIAPASFGAAHGDAIPRSSDPRNASMRLGWTASTREFPPAGAPHREFQDA